VVVVSPHLMAQVDARFAPLAPRTVLTNCPQPLPCTGPRQPRHWLCLAKIEPRKNLHHLLDGYTLYARTVPAGQEPLPLIMAGDDGYTAHAEELHGRIRAMQAQGLAVSFQPSVSDAVLADLFAHAAALVSPSLFEGFGFPPLEAMLQLVPVIAVPTGMLQGPLGAHVQPISGHDPQQLAQALHTVASQPPDSAHRQQARQAVLRCFDAQAHAQAWTDLIRSTAERGRGLTQIKGCGLI
jgi:glycosyltransferase involved in cell wall biosynthesis